MRFIELASKAENIVETSFKLKNAKALKASIIYLAQEYAKQAFDAGQQTVFTDLNQEEREPKYYDFEAWIKEVG